MHTYSPRNGPTEGQIAVFSVGDFEPVSEGFKPNWRPKTAQSGAGPPTGFQGPSASQNSAPSGSLGRLSASLLCAIRAKPGAHSSALKVRK